MAGESELGEHGAPRSFAARKEAEAEARMYRGLPNIERAFAAQLDGDGTVPRSDR